MISLTSKIIQALLLGGAIFNILFNEHAFATSEIIKKARLSSCNKDTCTQLAFTIAERSYLDCIYVFTQATMQVIPQKNSTNKKQTTYSAEDGYYDPESQRVILRGLKNSKYQELVWNLKNNQATFF